MAAHPDWKAAPAKATPMSIKVGWMTAEFPRRPSRRAVWMKSGAMVTMRYRNLALWLNRNGLSNSFYRSGEDYDVVVIIKTFTDAVLDEVNSLRRKGTPIIFDANVNYYTIWGNYTDPKTRPTPDLQRAAKQITRLADHVIADSEYLRDVIRDFNPRVTWIPDNVWPLMFRPARHREQSGVLRLIWSGIAFKADELLLIKDALAAVDGLELWLVSDARPPVMESLQDALPVHWFGYSDLYYAWLLGRADAIISPRTLNNGYNLGHTEYKISLGMARCLPAIASPQPAYVTAIAQDGGGILCDTSADWQAAFTHLRDDVEARLRMGRAARRTVEHHYLTPVVAQKLRQVILQTVS
jgi:glycosyltransferase involved in cell wall biosynthesis